MGDIVGRIGVLNPSTGEINEIELSVRKSGKRRTITSMYGPTWIAIPTSAYAQWAQLRHVSQFRVLHYLLSEMDNGNEIKVRVVDVAAALAMARPQASRALAALKAKGIILDRVPFGFRLHPSYGWRGSPAGKVMRTAVGLELVT